MDILKSNQKEIIKEVADRNLQSGGLSLPLGFGKTRLGIYLGLSYKCGLVLVVVSKTVLTTWISEIPKAFGESLQIEILHSNYIKDIGLWKPKPETKLVLTTPEVLATGYEEYNLKLLFLKHNIPVDFGPTIVEYLPPKSNLLIEEHTGIGYVYSVIWGCLIIDEIQNHNNILRNKCRAISCVAATHRWGLSGTMFDEPKVERFLGYFIMLNLPGPRTIPDMKEHLATVFKGFKHYIVHRTENSEFVNRPKYIERIITHNLSQEETDIFDASREVLKELNIEIKKKKKANDTDGVRKFSAYLLAMITYVRQFLVCPIIPITSVYCDVADFSERSDLSKIIVKKFKTLHISEWLESEKSLISTRFQEIIKKIDNHSDERIIIFSCFRTTITLLEHNVSKVTDRPLFTINSGSNISKREKIIQDFEESTNGIMFLPYSLGAEGLNLQCASVVMIMDLWWNSSKIQQAIGRIFRPGQKSLEIYIYIFISNTGMETEMVKKNIIKQEILKDLHSGPTTKQIARMTVQQIVKLIENSSENGEYMKMSRT